MPVVAKGTTHEIGMVEQAAYKDLFPLEDALLPRSVVIVVAESASAIDDILSNGCMS